MWITSFDYVASSATFSASQVSVEAIDRCSYLCWNREKLQYYLDAIPELKSAFNFIRGKDIVEKVGGEYHNIVVLSNYVNVVLNERC